MWYDRPRPTTGAWRTRGQEEWEWHCYRTRGERRTADSIAAERAMLVVKEGVPPLPKDKPRPPPPLKPPRGRRRDDELDGEIRVAKDRQREMAQRMGLTK